MPKYLKVADSDMVTVIPEKEEDSKMVDDKVFALKDQLANIEKVMLADKNAFTNELRELVAGLAKLGDSVTNVDQKVEAKVGRDEVESLISQCLKDPGGEACRLIEAQAAKSAEVAAEEAGKPVAVPNVSLSHKSWADVMDCPKCAPSFARWVGERKDLLQKALEAADGEILPVLEEAIQAKKNLTQEKPEGGF